MATKRFYWLKLNEGFFNRNDVRYLEMQEKGYAFVLLYIKLMLLGINSEGALYFKKNIPFNKTTLSMITGMDAALIEEALSVFTELGMTETNRDGVIKLCEYDDMVGSESDAAARMRKRRAEKEDESVTMLRKNEHCYREIEIDKEKEKEKEKDIDIEIELESYKEGNSDKKSYGTHTSVKESDFKFPSLEEVNLYCSERGSIADAEKFYDHYSAIGWRIGGSPIVDWKAAFRKWEKTEREQYKSNHQSTAYPSSEHAQSEKKGSYDTDDFFEAALRRSYESCPTY